MAVVIQSYATNRNSSAGLSLSINKPTGVVSGDLLVLIVNAGTTRTASCSGFAALGHIAGVISRVSILYKVAGGSEPSSYTVNLNGSSSISAQMLRIDGTIDPALNTIELSTNSGSGTGNATTPSVTPSDDNSLVIRIAGSGRGGSFSTTPSTLLFNDTAGIPNTGITYENCNATPSGTANFTYTPTWHEWVTATIALAPSTSTFTPRAALTGVGY